jgi:hypothetical protein
LLRLSRRAHSAAELSGLSFLSTRIQNISPDFVDVLHGRGGVLEGNADVCARIYMYMGRQSNPGGLSLAQPHPEFSEHDLSQCRDADEMRLSDAHAPRPTGVDVDIDVDVV